MIKTFYVDLYPGWHLNQNTGLMLSENIWCMQPPEGFRRVKVTVDLPEFGGATDEREGIAEELK